jgi:large subunit ribosomal protein L17
MRHRVDGRLFGRTANQRKALLRGLVASLLEHQRIETTVQKAKEVRRIAEKMITLGIRGDLHAKRLVFSCLSNRAVVAKLFNEIAPRFSGRNGGYLRIVQTRNRVKDASPMAVLEFIDYEEVRKSKEVESDKKVSKKSASQPGGKS